MTETTAPPRAAVRDLREAIELLKQNPGQFVSTSVEVDPQAELAGVYKKVGAGGTVQRPNADVVDGVRYTLHDTDSTVERWRRQIDGLRNLDESGGDTASPER
ncbi:hypothetical protein [Mycolicibacterium cosmeticum]|uniref:Uncharacterized protein n=1 Tax=Mycolicibacterium cosmeticum TaxID=258533 RepID=W9AM98_MYCCO|nr:hypothetical protein [Mycolicibacterium cosmeticum]CDO06568.1 hypothetical protein BN977_01361 [Mycolicibacterium cosmeticum]